MTPVLAGLSGGESLPDSALCRQFQSQMKLSSGDKAVIGILLIGAVAIGIWLNQVAFRNRRLLWRLQGGLVAGAAGFVVGRLTAESTEDP